MQYSIAIIGGGASGLAAAVAALHGARAAGQSLAVTVLERQDRVGKKILATGNGRCNLTNAGAAMQHYRSQSPQQVSRVLQEVPPAQVLEFFSALGLLCTQKEEGRVYPASNQASGVLELLRAELARCGGAEVCGFCAASVEKQRDGSFQIVAQNGQCLRADRVLVCTGGLAAPHLGCDETGYGLLRGTGHTLVPVYPCLVPIKTESPYPKALKGTKVFCTLRLLAGTTVLGEETGEVLFADYGLSGIPAMQLSGLVHSSPAQPKTLELNLMPGCEAAQTAAYVHTRTREMAAEPLEQLLTGAVPKKVGHMVLKAAGLYPLTRLCGSLTGAEHRTLAHLLQHWPLRVAGTLGWSAAQCTGGGVSLQEVNVDTMESCRCEGLYVCGEALDAVGLCGGYNLQWAWATGILAGRAAANSVL